MQEKRVRFGDYIKRLRLRDSRELRQSDIAEDLGISTGLYGDIENRRRRPFGVDKIERFAEILGLTADEKVRLYDLASHETNEVPADIEDIFMYDEIGTLARTALRETKAGNADGADWREFLRMIEVRKTQHK